MHNKTRDILSDFSSILTNKHVHSMAIVIANAKRIKRPPLSGNAIVIVFRIEV